jgi:K+ transporter
MHTIYSLSRVILHAQLYPHPHEYPARSIHYYQTGAGALGVVYVDIGTSPLYALRECFHASHGLTVTLPTIVGLPSLIIWAPLLVVTVKYLLFVMQADNQGEGGIVAHGLGQRHWEESAFPLRLGSVISGTAVYLTQFPDLAPPSFVQNVRHNKVLHEQLVFLTTTTTRVPTAVIMSVSNRSRRVFDELWCNMDSWRPRTLLACSQPAGHRG